MTTKEYITKYKLDKSDKFNHTDFVQDLASDLIALLEINKANDNIKGFDNAIRCIRMKFDAINNKTLGEIPEKLWNYFYATVIVKLREELCPKDMKKRREVQEQKKKEWEERKKQREWENSQFNDYFNSFFWGQNFHSYLFTQTKSAKPTESFAILGISENSTESDVITAYRKLSVLHHPDKGGKQEKFVEITESKNKCLNWINSQSSK